MTSIFPRIKPTILLLMTTIGLNASGDSLLPKKPVLYGSYANSIKKSSLTSEDDVDLIVKALKKTHQNLFGYSVDTEDHYTSGSTSGLFIDLLDKTKGSKVKVFGVLHERHLNESNPWITVRHFYDDDGDGFCDIDSDGADDDSDDTVCFGDWSAGRKELWKDAWVSAISELSKLSLSYPHFIGITIDDFGMYACSVSKETSEKADGCYTVSDVTEMREAAHNCSGCNPKFNFFPTVYFAEELPTLTGQSIELGQNYKNK